MNRGTIFTRTDKGEQMAASDSRELANDLRKVLSAIDGTSSVEELQTRLNFRSADWLDRSVAALLARDLIREAEGSAGMLDFTSIAPAAPDEQQRKAAEQARKEAEQQAAKKQAEEQARRQAEEKVRHEAAERARKEAEQQAAKKLAEEQARRQAEEKARHEAAERARKEAEQQAAKKLAEEQARKQAEDQELKQAAERVRLKAAEQAREEAEKQAKQAEEQELKQAAERVRQKAAERARQEAEEQARKLAEEQARKDAEEQERRKAAERAREEAEQQARKLAEEQTRREAAERARQEAEQQARKLAEELERRDGEEKARREAEEKARYEAEARIRREVEEKARHEAEETARRQAEERTRRDAEEKTRHAAEEKARYEAEEKVRREAGEKARHEAERARQEAEAQAQRTADDAGRHEAEEAARREAERVRQEAAANDRMAAEEKAWREAEDKFRREEQEAAAKRDKRATAKEAKSGSAKPSNRARQLAAGITALLVIGVVAVHLVSFDGQIPQFEKSLAAQFQQPVKIKSLRLSLVPQRHVRLEGVSIGNEGQISIPEIKAIGALGNLVNDRKAFSAVELNSPVVTEEGLGWILFGEAQAQGVAFGPVTVLNAKLQSKNVSLPAFDAKLQPDGQGDWKTIVMESTDKNLSLELTPKDQSVQIDLKARTFKLPFGSTLVLDELVASATANKAGLAVTEFKAFAYGGILSGNAGLKWGAQWSLSGELNAKQVDASRLFPGIVDDGRLVGTAAYAMQAADAGKLFATRHLEGDFKVARGNLLGVDFGRMIQGGATSGTTKFAELSGAFVHDRGATQLRQMRLHEGAMAASGTAEVDATDNVRGRLAIELRMASELRRASLAVGGTLQKIEWRRQ